MVRMNILNTYTFNIYQVLNYMFIIKKYSSTYFRKPIDRDSSSISEIMWPNLRFPADLVTCTKEILHGNLHFFVQWVLLAILNTFTATLSLLTHFSAVLHSMFATWNVYQSCLPVIWFGTQIQIPFLQIFKSSHTLHNLRQQSNDSLVHYLDPLPNYLAGISINNKKVFLFFTKSSKTCIIFPCRHATISANISTRFL